MSKNTNNKGNDTGNNIAAVQNTQGVMNNIDDVVSGIVDGKSTDNRIVSNTLREIVQTGQPIENADARIDEALAGMLGHSTGLAAIAETATVAEDEFIENNGGTDNAIDKSPYWNTLETVTEVSMNGAESKNSDLLDKLANIGMLKTINKLASTPNLSNNEIERASVALHMLINGLTQEQAIVVNKFYNMDVDVMQYVNNKFSAAQMFFIGNELKEGHDVSVICKTNEYTVSQMLEIQTSVHANLDISYVDPHMTPAVLGVLRKATILGIDITDIVEASKTLDAMQVEMLVNLKYFGLDIADILKNQGELEAEKLFATLQAYYTKRNALKCELSQDNNKIVQV